jgi:hypothetical protein
MGRIILSIESARAEVRILIQRATIPVRGHFFIHKITTHALNTVYMFIYRVAKKICSLFCRLKIHHVMEILNM